MDKPEWKSARDPKSGRIYYYNVKTKVTTWTKPLELATEAEKRAMIAEREATMSFFREMEDNIERKIEVAWRKENDYDNEIIWDTATRSISGGSDCNSPFLSGENSPHGRRESIGRERLNSLGFTGSGRVRTISTMDDELLMTMRRNTKASRHSRIFTNAVLRNAEEKESMQMRVRSESKQLGDRMSGFFPAESKISSDDKELLSKMDSPPKRARKNNMLKRRNSTGTIFVANTMSTQDNKATIECVCIVIRAHMLEAAKGNVVPLPEYDTFKDVAFADSKTDKPLIPSLETVKDFFMYIFSKSQLESDCIIMTLIYCERLVKETRGRLCIRYDNWRSILFACIVMASKVWDDLSMWNVDFSQVYPSFDLNRVNQLELAMLNALKYVIRVSASEYAKYYFLLRSMMVRLGLGGGNDPNQIRPLDLAGARKLQLSTEKYEQNVPRRRIQSVHIGLAEFSRQHSHESYDDGDDFNHKPVMLEQLTHSQHMDADGQVHENLAKKQSKQNLKLTKSGRSFNEKDYKKEAK